jgi:predicted amidophosphoribosyltransferase
MHELKYRGSLSYVELVAAVLAEQLPPLPITQVPRALSRRLKYGSDPARLIATALGRRLGVPVLDLLRAPIHRPRRAGGDHGVSVAGFARRGAVPRRLILLDDVVTTGATIVAAAASLGAEHVAMAVCANVAPTVSSLRADHRR